MNSCHQNKIILNCNGAIFVMRCGKMVEILVADSVCVKSPQQW